VREVGAHAVELLVAVAPVDAVDDEDDLLPPLADEREEPELAGGERLEEAGHEEHEVGARHEAARDLLLHALDGVGARRVDDLEVAQRVERVAVHAQVLAGKLRRAGLAVAQDRDDARGRQVAHGEHVVAEQGVDEGALPGVVLAGHDEEEELVHLLHERGEPLEVGARPVGAGERVAHREHQPALRGHQLGLLTGEDLIHERIRARGKTARERALAGRAVGSRRPLACLRPAVTGPASTRASVRPAR
jgi:hypothetical protein